MPVAAGKSLAFPADGDHAEPFTEPEGGGIPDRVGLEVDMDRAPVPTAEEDLPHQRLADAVSSGGRMHREILDEAGRPAKRGTGQQALAIDDQETEVGIELGIVRGTLPPFVE